MSNDVRDKNLSEDYNLRNNPERKNLSELKIKNRYFWLISINSTIIVLAGAYAFLFNDISFSITTLVSVLLAFFSIYLSALFYFKATEQSNEFYDNTYKHTKEIHVLLSKMEGKFNKSLDVIEEGNNTIREKISVRPEYFQDLDETNHSIKNVDNKRKEFLEEELFSKLQISEKEKEKISLKLAQLEKEKSVLKYELKEILEKKKPTTLSNEHISSKRDNYADIKKWYQNYNGPESLPGTFYEAIYRIGPRNILMMATEELRTALRQEYLLSTGLDSFDKEENVDRIKDVILTTLINLGVIDESTNDISTELIERIKEEAKKYVA
ncbi:MAG: hypothetical protein KC455_12045 [Carnobacterium sp.]|nr:hypothetical protein [Carnobacterium sp.]